MAWERPSPRVAELIRNGASAILAAPDELFDEVDAAVLSDAESPIAADPVLAAAVRRGNRANLTHWAAENVRDPGAPVKPLLDAEQLSTARDLVRRGLDATALEFYRVGQNIGWRRWMDLGFELTRDPDELREFLDVSSRSIFSYVDTVIAAVAELIEQERDELTRGSHAQRLEVVSLLLEGAPIGQERASVRLGYDLGRSHTAAIVWSDEPDSDPVVLEQAAEAIGRAAGARPLTVTASASSLWVWVPGPAEPEPVDGVRVALGPLAAGMAGFRRSHLDALATQRLMARTNGLALARYEDVQAVTLATQDEERADEFVRRTLGDLLTAPAELRDTARVYLREGSSATRASRALFTHRNTVVSRLTRIEELLPEPLDGRTLHVALALEIVHWRGA
jgi:DNA-binding PucR family transcriptional regulator